MCCLVWLSSTWTGIMAGTRKGRLYKILFITATVSTLALLYFFMDARKPGFFPSCPFYSLTGLYCPGCGSQRAISSLLHLHFAQALHFNLLLVLTLPLVIYSAVVFVLNSVRKKQVEQAIFYSPLFTKVLLVVVVSFGVLRNVHVYPFYLLAPHGWNGTVIYYVLVSVLIS